MVFQEEAFAPAAPWADQRASSLGAHFLFSPSGGGYKECLSAVLSWLTAHHGHNVTLGGPQAPQARVASLSVFALSSKHSPPLHTDLLAFSL